MPLRSFLICPTCGKILTGSSSKGRNAYYDYYHCSKGCRTSFKAESVHAAFVALLKGMVPNRAYRTVFKEITRDVFKQQTSGRQNHRLQAPAQLEILHSRLRKARELLLNEAFGTDDYQEIKKECDKKITWLELELNSSVDMAEAITQLLNRYGNRFLDLADLFEGAVLEDKRKLLARLFPESIIFQENKFEVAELPKSVGLIYTAEQH
jgi:site-specific DNA recombinase